MLIKIDIYFIASTTFLAASFKSDADNIFKFDLSKISLPFSKFVPANLTTRGTDKLISLAASTTPLASTSHCIMPPKIFIRIPFTFLSDKINLNAAETFSFEAPPPTSKKFAGSCP